MLPSRVNQIPDTQIPSLKSRVSNAWLQHDREGHEQRYLL
jgi:hypothetical protein